MSSLIKVPNYPPHVFFLDDGFFPETTLSPLVSILSVVVGGGGDFELLPPTDLPLPGGDLFPVTRGEADLETDLELDFCLTLAPEN